MCVCVCVCVCWLLVVVVVVVVVVFLYLLFTFLTIDFYCYLLLSSCEWIVVFLTPDIWFLVFTCVTMVIMRASWTATITSGTNSKEKSEWIHQARDPWRFFFFFFVPSLFLSFSFFLSLSLSLEIRLPFLPWGPWPKCLCVSVVVTALRRL